METLIQAAHVELRRAHLSDVAQLLELIKAYYRFDHITFNAKSVRAALRELLQDRSLGLVWIMRDAEKPVGYIVLTFNYDIEFGGLEGLITDLFVRSQYRSRGLGRRAIATVQEHCRSVGIRAIELQVERSNKAARQFYVKMGFRRLHRMVMTKDC